MGDTPVIAKDSSSQLSAVGLSPLPHFGFVLIHFRHIGSSLQIFPIRDNRRIITGDFP
jgi:hypothetical protein